MSYINNIQLIKFGQVPGFQQFSSLLHKLFFSTDTLLTGEKVLDFYRTRFQIEFCFRDAKQYCGLTDSQARDGVKLDCAFNASFASLNVAKVMMKERGMHYSMSNFKLLMTNTFQRIY
jgi:hypothetical protein